MVEGVASDRFVGSAQVDFSRSGMMVYVKAGALKQTLVWLDSSGHMQPLRSTPAEYYGPLRFSLDGKRLAVSVAEGGKLDVWVYEWRDTERSTGSAVCAPDRGSFPDSWEVSYS